MDDLKNVNIEKLNEFKHKLNNYVSSIWGYLQIIQKKGNLDDETKSMLEEAISECQKLIEYIENYK